jgi:hypothetical protein
MIRFLVVRPKDNVIVALLPNKKNNKYSFVNLTKGHICPCKFETVEDALKDMENQQKLGKVIEWIKF